MTRSVCEICRTVWADLYEKHADLYWKLADQCEKGVDLFEKLADQFEKSTDQFEKLADQYENRQICRRNWLISMKSRKSVDQ